MMIRLDIYMISDIVKISIVLTALTSSGGIVSLNIIVELMSSQYFNVVVGNSDSLSISEALEDLIAKFSDILRPLAARSRIALK